MPDEEGESLPEFHSPQRRRDLLPATATIATTFSRGDDFMMQLSRQMQKRERGTVILSARVMRHADAGVLIAEQ